METRNLRIVYHEDKDILSLVVPPLRPFSIEGSPVRNVTLLEVLEWAYWRHVVKHIPAWEGREEELYVLAA